MLTMFFVYFEYGIIESIKNKENYTNIFLKNRFLKTLLHFDFAVLLYLFLSIILNIDYSVFTNTLAFTGRISIENSNWLVFVMLSLYLIIYFSYLIFRSNIRNMIFLNTILSCLLILI